MSGNQLDAPFRLVKEHPLSKECLPPYDTTSRILL